MRRIPKIIAFSTLLGLLLLGISDAITRGNWRTIPGVPAGFPLAYTYANPPTCGKLNPLNGCGYSYDPVSVVLDYLFWLAIALAGVSALDIGWSRFKTRKVP